METLLSGSVHGRNPFPAAKDDKPVSAIFRWNEPNDIYGITNSRGLSSIEIFLAAASSGSFEHQEGEWKTTIKLKADLRIYDASHPSGHFKKIVWKKGVGLVEYASGYGAHADGYRLKREVTSQKR